MDIDFGRRVADEAKRLLASGKDANQTANILFQRDPSGRNYGIGIILDGKGRPASTSPALLKALFQELKASGSGAYMNSAKSMRALKEKVLDWQRIPRRYLDRFQLAIPSDAGTGAVTTAIQTARLLDSEMKTLAIEPLSWPAYRTIAKVLRLSVTEFSLGGACGGPGVLPVYQAGPHNSTGRAPQPAEVKDRARAAKQLGGPVLLDRAYSGFEAAGALGKLGYDSLMRLSYETQLKPFIDAGVPFFLAISPTKVFVTFACRPCGFLLAYSPDGGGEVQGAFNAVIRARGSAFEPPSARALVKTMTTNLKGLERDHQGALKRLAAAEKAWGRHCAGTPLAKVFHKKYAGLFRNVPVLPGAAAAVYGEHLYPVFSGGRLRLNITGLPASAARAKDEAAIFARVCAG